MGPTDGERAGQAGTAAGPCPHGGAFFDAIGADFGDLERRHGVISADVLDAWFPPAPAVLEDLAAYADFLSRTSPPVHAEGLVATLARTRRVPPEALLCAAGSSALIFLAFTRWLTPASRALICDPTYGEYAHVLEHVVGCTVERLPLHAQDGYRLPPATLDAHVQRGYDLVVLVNPNSPTGTWLAPERVRALHAAAPPGTRFWIDETYVDFVDPAATLEAAAAVQPGLVVCKSMSKAYALSGLRVAYLCATPESLTDLRRRTPPWAVSLPAQLAAVRALTQPDYYRARWVETRALRTTLATDLAAIPGWQVHEGAANFLLCRLPADGPDARAVVDRARDQGLFVRDVRAMGCSVDDRTLRVAVKDAATNRRMAVILRTCAASAPPERQTIR